MSNKRAFFKIYSSIDKEQVEIQWREFCENRHFESCDEGLIYLQVLQKTNDELKDKEKDPVWLKNFLDQYELRGGSPMAFDDYQIEWKEGDQISQLSNFHQVREWILNHHTIRFPALAVPFKEKTIIGGWVFNR
jgi:hypothetical protein